MLSALWEDDAERISGLYEGYGIERVYQWQADTKSAKSIRGEIMKKYYCDYCKKEVYEVSAISVNGKIHLHQDCLLACLTPKAVITCFWPVLDEWAVKRVKENLNDKGGVCIEPKK